MSNSKTIREVFNTEHYIGFVRFCEERGLVNMSDLLRCPFDQLTTELGTGTVLRIKSMITLYRKNHPEEFIHHKAAGSSSLSESLQEFFRKNPGRIIHISELCKAVRARKNDIIPVLQQASWCQMVDLNNYYYK